MPKRLSKERKNLKKELKNDPFVWIVAYIDAKFLHRVEKDLNKYRDYKQIEVYIPTVKILKKTFKRQNIFEEVPLLFNYGFFKVPRKMAIYRDWLEDFKRNIPCIYGWVQDPANTLMRKPILREDNKSVFDNEENKIACACVSSSDITRLLRDTVNLGAHSADDIALLNAGDPIVLRGYPWEGVHATVKKIDPVKEKVTVEMRIFDQMKEVLVSYDNVFFTIYHQNQHDDSLTNNQSIDTESGLKKVDKIQKKKYGTEN